MSLRIRRYNANESDFTKDGRTRGHIDIPSTVGFTDLTSSKLVLDMKINVSDTAGTVLLPATFGTNSQMVGAQALIKNCKVVSKENGFMNEQRNQNVVAANLDWYQKSRAAEDAGSLFGNSTNHNYGNSKRSKLPDNPWFDYRRPTTADATVTDNAVTRNAEIPIMWRHVDEFGQMSQFPNIAVGDLNYQIEFEDQIDTVSPADMPYAQIEPCDNIQLGAGVDEFGTATNPLVFTKTANNFWKPPIVGQSILVLYKAATGGVAEEDRKIASITTVAGKYHVVLDTEITVDANDLVSLIHAAYYVEALNLPALCDDITPTANVIGDATHPLVLEDHFTNDDKPSHNECALYIGAPISVIALDGTANTIHFSETTVASLTIAGANLEVVLATPLSVGTNNQQTNIYISYRTSTANTKFTVSWQVDEMYAQLHEIQLMPTQKESARKALANLEIPFVSQYLKQRNMPSTTVHTEVIEAAPNCLGLSVLTPQNLTLLSGFDNCTSYRFSIDGKEQTNRDINVGEEKTVARQLHNYMLKRFHGNMGKKLLKYDANTTNYSAPNVQTTHSMFPLVTPMVPRPLIVQLILQSDTPMVSKNIFYVFHHQKVLKLSNGRAQVV